MITIDQLFAEDFKPEWMKRKERFVQEGLDQAVTTSTNFAYEKAAEESRLRIAARCDAKARYANH